jgi:hypothetical protein
MVDHAAFETQIEQVAETPHQAGIKAPEKKRATCLVRTKSSRSN